MYVCVCVYRIVSMDKILCFINTAVIIITTCTFSAFSGSLTSLYWLPFKKKFKRHEYNNYMGCAHLLML